MKSFPFLWCALIFLECSIFCRWLGLLNVYSQPHGSPWIFFILFFFVLLSSLPPISVSAWVWKINDINPGTAVAFTSPWIRTTFIKSQHVCMVCSQSRGRSPVILDGPYFSVFLQECFAWSSQALAGQWLMSRLWRCNEVCRCKTPHKSTNYLSSYLTVLF